MFNIDKVVFEGIFPVFEIIGYQSSEYVAEVVGDWWMSWMFDLKKHSLVGQILFLWLVFFPSGMHLITGHLVSFHVLSGLGYHMCPAEEGSCKEVLGMYPLSLKGLPYSFAMKCLALGGFPSSTLTLVTIKSMPPSISSVMIWSLKRFLPLDSWFFEKKDQFFVKRIDRTKNPSNLIHKAVWFIRLKCHALIY